MSPDLVDRLLWWVCASLSYIVLVGAATLALKMTKRPEIPGMPTQRSRNEQFAGFLLGIAKGGLIGAFLVGALDTYGLKQIESIPWAEKQARSSLALQWNNQYHPAAKIWTSVPVRHFVNHIQRMGLQAPTDSSPQDRSEDADGRPVVQTARRASSEGLRKATGREDPQGLPAPPPAPTSKAKVPVSEVEQTVEDIKAALDAAAKPN